MSALPLAGLKSIVKKYIQISECNLWLMLKSLQVVSASLSLLFCRQTRILHGARMKLRILPQAVRTGAALLLGRRFHDGGDF